MRLDAPLGHKPTQHLGRPVSAVAEEPAWLESQALHRTFDHALCSENFCLPDCGGRFDVNDDRVIGIDQIVGRVGKEGLPAVRTGPARRRIGR